MADKIKEYFVETGCVTLYDEGNSNYCILQEVQKTPGIYHCHEWQRRGLAAAEEKFQECVRTLETRSVVQTCGLRGAGAMCDIESCPPKRGGAGFWKLHHLICPYRGR